MHQPLLAWQLTNSAAARRSYLDSERLFDLLSPWGQRNYWKSNGMNAFSDEAIEAIVEAFESRARRSPRSSSSTSTARSTAPTRGRRRSASTRHRQPLVNAKWLDPATGCENIGWARDSFASLRPYRSGGAYVNYLLAEPEERIRAAHAGDVHDRLARLKGRHDPDNAFRFNQNVRPAELTDA